MLATLPLRSSIFVFLLIAVNGASLKENDELLKFPPGFAFGAATASYQVEGAWNVSDKGVSTWDYYTHLKDSRVYHNQNGDVAANSYYKYKEDVAILKELGFTTYRFSLSWTRILPTGFPNKVSKDGVRYYNELIDELLANGIEPLLTIYHWDHPQVLEEAGGWLNPEMVDWFADFARVVYKEFGPKVKKIIPINEPTVICTNGYSSGIHSPGKRLHGFGEYLCIHNVLKAHARAYRIYEKEFKPTQKGEVGFLVNALGYMPKYPGDMLSTEIAYQFNVGWTMNPIYYKDGDYPLIMKTMVGFRSEEQGYARSRLPEFDPEWIAYIRGSADFLALNHYTSRLVQPGESGKVPSQENDQGLLLEVDKSWKSSASSWLQVAPEGFRVLLREIARRYGNPPIYITENGVSDDGTLEDDSRIDYHREYLKQMLLAVHEDGVDVRGYCLWSLLDNFEWNRGYSERFGIVNVDFNNPNRSRTFKKSALWWQKVIADKMVPEK